MISDLIKEAMDEDPRIATQLISPEDAKESKTDGDGDEELDEFCAVGGGAVSGYSAPLMKKKKM